MYSFPCLGCVLLSSAIDFFSLHSLAGFEGSLKKNTPFFSPSTAGAHGFSCA